MTRPAPEAAPTPETPSSPAPPVLLLGLGNDILTDDAVGLHVVHALQRELAGRLPLSLDSTDSGRRFPLSPSEGERAGVRGPSLPGASEAQSTSKSRGELSLDIRETTEMGLALLDFITGYRTVVIVDSIQTGKAAPGFLHELDAADFTHLTGRTPHFVGVSETLALGRHLGLAMPKRVTIFAIEVEDSFTLGTALTPALQAALPAIVARIRAALKPLLRFNPGTFPS